MRDLALKCWVVSPGVCNRQFVIGHGQLHSLTIDSVQCVRVQKTGDTLSVSFHVTSNALLTDQPIITSYVMRNTVLLNKQVKPPAPLEFTFETLCALCAAIAQSV
jgi:hypothetical protein